MIIPQIFLILKAKFGDKSPQKLNQIPEIVETYQWVLTSIKADTRLCRTGTSKCLCLVEIYLIKVWKIPQYFMEVWLICYRSIRPEVFFKKRCSWNFTKLIGKHLLWSLFLTKLEVFRPLLKRDSNRGVWWLIVVIVKN